jgi:hypothetical protein
VGFKKDYGTVGRGVWYIRGTTSKNLRCALPNQNGLKQGDGFSPLLFSVTGREARNNEDILKLTGMHEFLICVDDLRWGGGGYVNAMKKNLEALLGANRGSGLEGNN